MQKYIDSDLFLAELKQELFLSLLGSGKCCSLDDAIEKSKDIFKNLITSHIDTTEFSQVQGSYEIISKPNKGIE